MDQFNRQHRSVQIRDRKGNLINDRALKDDETIEIINVKQINAIKRKRKNTSDIQEHIRVNEGSFIHLIYKYGYPLMDKLQAKCDGNKANIHIIRFIQLATYSTFGGKLFDTNWNRIRKSSLKTIWDTTSRNSINETYELLMDCDYIYETEEGYIMISEELIVKGAIEDFKRLKKDDKDLTYTRVFSNNVQDMYIGTEPKARKQLANLFKVLPYINFKYNIFCANPTETDKEKLELYTWTDLARICGYDETNLTKFKRELWKLKIYGFNTIGQFSSGDNYYICVNPKVYYAGDNKADVDFLYKSFEMLECMSKVKRTRIKKN